MTATPDPTANSLLSALSRESFDRIAPHLERLTLAPRHLVYEPDVPIKHVYFPINCVISLVSVMADESLVEVATIGREGMVGMSAFWGTETMPMRAFAQVPGDAFRMSADAFRAEVVPGGELAGLLLRYTQAVFHQVARSAACNQVHPIGQRCARWLLMSHDRVGKDQFELTQEFLAQMLGVRRARVGVAAGAGVEPGTNVGRGRIIRPLRSRGGGGGLCGCHTAGLRTLG